tara:strand:+ start:1929 stop:2801 length:873 start_codon:yes stop_codon:yes gene_type:complete
MSNTVYNDVDLKKYSWFNLGGLAKKFFKPKSIQELSDFLNTNKIIEKDIHVLGAGSNTLFRDGGFDGTVIKLGNEFGNIKLLNDGNLEVGGACLDKKIANFALENSIKDLEFLSCIPGSIGGTVTMNSGCYGYEISDSILSVDVLKLNGEHKTFTKNQIKFFYRGSHFGERVIIIKVQLKASKGNKDEIKKKQNEFLNIKKETQPSRIKTCGSTFKNSSDKKAWQLIKEAGCANLSIGGAKLSQQHCNFFVNDGKATAKDIEKLIMSVKNKVYSKTGIKLDLEIKIVGKK